MTVHEYFQSYNNFIWQWEDEGEVLAIPNGDTIAYKAFVADVLEQLCHQGIPPFGALTMALIATNPNGKKSIVTIQKIFTDLLKTADDAELFRAIEFLNLLADIPDEFKKGKKRLLVLQSVFENCHNSVSVKKSKKIAHDFRAEKFDFLALSTKIDISLAGLRREIKTICVQKNRITTIDELLEKVLALPQVNEVLELEEISEDTEPLSLTDQLIQNPKTFHVGALVKHIWSGLNIPFHSTIPSQQPLGGVSDLTNKGDFDKLLVSEFANDDIVFLSRLANNEALYIHREIPPSTNKLERIILIDVSLKTWGTPKSVAFATMLAIATHPKNDIPCSVYTVGNTYKSISIKSIETIIDGLQILESSLHAANGLNTFFHDYPATANREFFLITEPSTLKHSAMAKAMSDHQPSINYLLFSDTLGNIDIYKKQQKTKKHIQHLQLPLQKLWEHGNKKQVHTSSEKNRNYPLLFRSSKNIKALLTTPDGQIFIATADKALLRLFDSDKVRIKGWELLLDKALVFPGQYEIGLSQKGEYILLMLNIQTHEISLFNLSNQEKVIFPFPQWKSTHQQGFISQDGKFYHLNSSGCWAIDFKGVTSVDPTTPSIPGKLVYANREEELSKVMSTFKSDQAAFRNVKDIFINENNRLVFNVHEWIVNKGSHLKLDITTNKEKKVMADKITDTQFTFHDGSKIEINKIGIFILESSNKSIPVIYLPSMLDSYLAVATDKAFAGNDFYYPESQFGIHLIAAGEKKINLIKKIKDLTPLGLNYVNQLISETPCCIINYVSKNKAENIKMELETLGATVEIRPAKPGVNELEKMSVNSFYDKYIQAFITHILQHETQY